MRFAMTFALMWSWVLASVAAAGVLKLEVTVPAGTAGDVFVSGSVAALGPWNPAGMKLTRGEDGIYRGEVAGEGALEFKFTRGDWGTVEKAANGDDRTNRTAQFPADGAAASTVQVKVERWGSGGAAATTRQSTITGRVELHQVASKILGNTRRVWVWLPPGYEGATDWTFREGRPAVYPVFYVHDGRNVFDEATSAFGREWGMDESATKLIEAGEIRPLIIVGVDHGDQRTEELGGKELEHGKRYGRFVVEEVMPFINVRYRTNSGPANTFVGGASLGGLVSLAMLMDFPKTFGGGAVVSPSLFFEDAAVLKRAEAGGVAKGARVWVDMGTAEGERHVANTRRLSEALKKQGVAVEYEEAKGAEHNEAAWAERTPRILKFLFGK